MVPRKVAVPIRLLHWIVVVLVPRNMRHLRYAGCALAVGVEEKKNGEKARNLHRTRHRQTPQLTTEFREQMEHRRAIIGILSVKLE